MRPPENAAAPGHGGPGAGDEVRAGGPGPRHDRTAPGPADTYYAVADPLGLAAVSYWYRQQDGHLAPWPPRRNRWGVLWKRDVPAGLTGDTRRAFVRAHFDRVAEARRAVEAAIAADPLGCAARFAALAARCCYCGKTLTDDRSKVYGIGPDCRHGLPAGVLSAAVEAMRRAYGAKP